VVAGITTEREPRARVAARLLDPERVLREDPAWAARLARAHDPVQGAGAWRGFDAHTGQIVDMWNAGIVDPISVLQRALETAPRAGVKARRSPSEGGVCGFGSFVVPTTKYGIPLFQKHRSTALS